MNIVEIIKKAPEDHVYWCTLIGECKVRIATLTTSYPIIAIANSGCEYEITKSGRYFYAYPYAECVLFPSRDNRDWAAFERELDGKPEEKKPLFHSESESFDDSIEMVSIPDRPMMAAVIMSGLLAGGCKDKGAALINKTVNYADMILEYTKEESNDKC